MSHRCNMNMGRIGWSICSVCCGRIHLEGCTSQRDRTRDCCEARHVMLNAQGETVGLDDSSLPMLGTHSKT